MQRAALLEHGRRERDLQGQRRVFPSVAIGTDNYPVISYYDVTNGDLKVAHISNASWTVHNNGRRIR